jgi:hypothetical protein
MTIAGDQIDQASAGRQDAGVDDSLGGRTVLSDVASRAMRVPWLWPTLLTLLLGLYQLGRPELWRDELWS